MWNSRPGKLVSNNVIQLPLFLNLIAFRLHSDVEHNLTDNCFNKGFSQRRAGTPTFTKQVSKQLALEKFYLQDAFCR